MERIGAQRRPGTPSPHDPGNPLGRVGGDKRDRRAPLGPEGIEERLEGRLRSTVGGPHEASGVMVDDDHEIALAAPVADLVDPDPDETGERVASGPRVGDDPGDDRSDRPPGDPGQDPDGALRAVRREPGDGVIEDVCVTGPMARPGHRSDDDPVLRALDPWRVGLEVGLGRAEIERPPAPSPVTRVVARAAPAADPAAAPVTPPQPNPNDEHVARLLELRVLDDRPLDTEQSSPYPHPAHAISSPWSKVLSTQTLAGGVRCRSAGQRTHGFSRRPRNGVAYGA
jgi:hypothetical protein